MSNSAPVVYLTKGFADSFKGFSIEKLESIARGLVPFDDAETVKPSAIKMNRASYATGMGAKASPVSILTSLLWGAAAYAHGQAKIEALQEGLPQLSQFAIVAACSPLKAGAGIDAATLRRAALMGIEKTLALGMKPKVGKPTISAHASAPASAPAPAISYGPLPVIRCMSGPLPAYDLPTVAAEIAAERAALLAKIEADKPFFVKSFYTVAERDKDQAFALLSELAAELGYTLRKSPAKKAA